MQYEFCCVCIAKVSVILSLHVHVYMFDLLYCGKEFFGIVLC